MSPRVRNIVIGVATVIAVIVGLMRVGRSRLNEAPASPAPAQPATIQIAEDAEPESLCPDKGAVAHTYGALDLIVERTKDDLCGFTVSGSGPKGMKLGEDEGALAISAQFADLNADAANELIVVADSGGSGLHANTFVFTQRPEPHLIEMYDGCASRVTKAPDGRRALMTCTLGMNMMDGVCNGCSPRPYIFYMFEGGKLVRRNDVFVATYDKRIAAEEKDIKPDEAEAFLKSESKDDGVFENSSVRDTVMRIAADYIWSGREAKAKAVIDKYWPAWDRERIFEDLGGAAPPRSNVVPHEVDDGKEGHAPNP